jgi:hypothetical protein
VRPEAASRPTTAAACKLARPTNKRLFSEPPDFLAKKTGQCLSRVVAKACSAFFFVPSPPRQNTHFNQLILHRFRPHLTVHVDTVYITVREKARGIRERRKMEVMEIESYGKIKYS